jgi:hypothetical protein
MSAKPTFFIPTNFHEPQIELVMFNNPKQVANAIVETNKQIIKALEMNVQMAEVAYKMQHSQQIIRAVPNPQGFLKQ